MSSRPLPRTYEPLRELCPSKRRRLAVVVTVALSSDVCSDANSLVAKALYVPDTMPPEPQDHMSRKIAR